MPYSYETWPRDINTPTRVEIPFVLMMSAGPTRACFPVTNYQKTTGNSAADFWYDSSNGTVSRGAIYRVAAIKDIGVAKWFFGPGFDVATK